jgi:hypothetical protein
MRVEASRRLRTFDGLFRSSLTEAQFAEKRPRIGIVGVNSKCGSQLRSCFAKFGIEIEKATKNRMVRGVVGVE